MSNGGAALASTDDLPKLIGYKQLHAQYGWPRRTLQDWIKNRKFPKPLDLPGRENYWYLDDVLIWLEKRRVGLAAVAISQPIDLSPDEVRTVAIDFAARLVSHDLGEPVAPEDVVIGRRIGTVDLSSPNREQRTGELFRGASRDVV